jgi:predicted transcriptional regulator
MPVEMYMSTPVHRVDCETPLPVVNAMLGAHQVSSVAVVDARGALVGVVSRTDLIQVGRSGAGRRPRSAVLTLPDRPAESVMSTHVATVAPDDSVRAAAALMLERRVHRVFVVDAGEIVGVLSTKDVMVAVSHEKVRLPIERFMSAPVFTIRASEPIALGIERLERAHVSGVVVVDDGWPVGVFTQAESIASADMPRNTPIEEVMCPAMLCMNVDTQVHRAAAQAAATRARRVIATAEQGMKGILTGLDFARATQEEP